jgi:hypothetical protein
MYSESELESAVAAGTLTREAADALRSHVSGLRNTPQADEEQFRLITGFNDIFVAIAGILVLVGAGWFGGALMPSLGGALVAAAAWGMAEFFTRVRRMALPSIIFFLAFVGGVYFTFLLLYPGRDTVSWITGINSRTFLLYQAGATAIVVGACWVHWKRFMVPITIATGVASIAQLAFTLIAAAFFPMSPNWTLGLLLVAGLVIFTYAMHWDSQDRARVTRKSDVAFWLHLSASPMIVHPIFVLMGMNLGMQTENATLVSIVAIGIYALLGVIALIVDRRAILVSALAYVLAAAIYLVSNIGIRGAGFAVVIIVIGSSLLMLSAFWQTMRRLIVPKLPEAIQERVPLLR